MVYKEIFGNCWNGIFSRSVALSGAQPTVSQFCEGKVLYKLLVLLLILILINVVRSDDDDDNIATEDDMLQLLFLMLYSLGCYVSRSMPR